MECVPVDNEALRARELQFDRCCQRFKAQRPGLLLAAYKIPDATLKAMQRCAELFLSRSLGCPCGQRPAQDLLACLATQGVGLENMTPNGKLMPKLHLALEYNLFIETVFSLLNELNIADLIDFYRLPTLRYKAGEADQRNIKRHYATEKPHLESWLGHPKEAVVFHVPLFGDVKNNYVQLFEPPLHYEESWSDPLTDFDQGEAFAAQHHVVNEKPRVGYLYLFSAISLHCSYRTKAAGGRISFEFTGALKGKVPTSTPSQSPLVNRPLDFKVSPQDITQSKFYVPKNSYSGAVEIERVISL